MNYMGGGRIAGGDGKYPGTKTSRQPNYFYRRGFTFTTSYSCSIQRMAAHLTFQTWNQSVILDCFV